MRKITVEEIAMELINNDSMEVEGDKVRYFLHITDAGEILPTLAGADETFTADTDAPNEDGDWREDFETLDNADFRSVCEDLMEQANDYLETWGIDEPEENAYDFVEELFNNSTSVRTTLEDAKEDLKNFQRAGWNIPTDLTAEKFVEIWNGLVDEYEKANEEE